MKNLICAVAFVAMVSPASANGFLALFTAPEQAQEPQVIVSRLYPSQTESQRRVAVLVAERAGAVLGQEWAETAVVIAKKESNFTCTAIGPHSKGSRAMGVMQVMPGTARSMGFNPKNLNDCRYGIDAGIEHMRRCLDAGAANHKLMVRCHQTGWGPKKNPATKVNRAKVSNRH